MLVDFTYENFKSFKETTIFSMERGKGTRKNNEAIIKNYDLLKSSLLFGANANGKTNLLRAMQVLRYLILNPTTNESDNLFVDTFGDNTDNTIFKIHFIKENQLFEYQLIYNKNEIVYEKLKIKKQVVFEREYQTFIKIPKQLNNVISNVRCNQNLLYFAQFNNVEEAKLAFDWFLNDLIIVDTEKIPNEAFKILLDEKQKKRFLNLLRAADFNIIDVEIRERMSKVSGVSFTIDNEGNPQITKLPGEPKDTIEYELYFNHASEKGDFQLDFNRESEGTKVFMFIALYFLNSENSGKIFLIDEFDKSFHIELAKALIDFINSENQNNQFIMTTHSIDLMDHMLRPDQIWFIEKNQQGESELFSLFDFDDPTLTRRDYSYKKRYLEGRLGATQIINKEKFLEVLGENNG